MDRIIGLTPRHFHSVSHTKHSGKNLERASVMVLNRTCMLVPNVGQNNKH